MAITNLTSILANYESDVKSVQDEVAVTVLNSNNLETMTAYGKFLEALNAYSANQSTPELTAKLNEAADIFQYDPKEDSVPIAEDNKDPNPSDYDDQPADSNANSNKKWLTKKEAYSLWREMDQEAGRRVLKSDDSYSFRLVNSAKKDKLIVKGQGKGKRYNRDSLIGFIDTYEYRKEKTSEKPEQSDNPKKDMPSKSNQKTLENEVVDINSSINNVQSKYGDSITPAESIKLYRGIEDSVEGIDNSSTNDTAYRARVYTMLKNGLSTNGDEGDKLRINKEEFLGKIRSRIENRLGKSSTNPAKKKRSKKKKSKRNKPESKYPEYKGLRKQGESNESIQETLGLEKSSVDAYSRLYSRWEDK